MLRTMTGRQYVEQQIYLQHVGRLGPSRWDFYNARSSMYAGGPYEDKVDWPDFMPIWPAEAAERAEAGPGRVALTNGRSAGIVTVQDKSSDAVKEARLAAMKAAVDAEATAVKAPTVG